MTRWDEPEPGLKYVVFHYKSYGSDPTVVGVFPHNQAAVDFLPARETWKHEDEYSVRDVDDNELLGMIARLGWYNG